MNDHITPKLKLHWNHRCIGEGSPIRLCLQLIGYFDNYYTCFINTEKVSNIGRGNIDMINAYRYLVYTGVYMCKFMVLPRVIVGKPGLYPLPKNKLRSPPPVLSQIRIWNLPQPWHTRNSWFQNHYDIHLVGINIPSLSNDLSPSPILHHFFYKYFFMTFHNFIFQDFQEFSMTVMTLIKELHWL